MDKICLDLDVVLDFLRGDKSTVEKIKYYADKEEICITAMTLIYLLLGVKKMDALRPFVNSISVLEFDRKTASLAAKIIEDNKEFGVDMDMDRVMTAATCLAMDACLFMKNRKGFEQIKNLKLV